MKNKIIIYQAKSGAIELKGDLKKETLWASQAQIADLFGVNSQAITKHIKNIYSEKELQEPSTCSILEQVQIEGNRKIVRKIKFYNLDVLIAVGYRINSVTGTKFRQWATKTLQSHIVEGYTINRKQIAKNYQSFISAVEDVKKFLPAGSEVGAEEVLELIKMFASTWFSLDAYDKEFLPQKGATKKQVKVTGENFAKGLEKLKQDLIVKEEASELFGAERVKGSMDGIIGNVFQSFEKKDLYPTVEEKAAHLLYFTVKNHPFVDGNKRSGAFAFVWFLKKAKVLDASRITPEALTALTLLVAESDPKDKDQIIGLVLILLK